MCLCVRERETGREQSRRENVEGEGYMVRVPVFPNTNNISMSRKIHGNISSYRIMKFPPAKIR